MLHSSAAFFICMSILFGNISNYLFPWKFKKWKSTVLHFQVDLPFKSTALIEKNTKNTDFAATENVIKL